MEGLCIQAINRGALARTIGLDCSVGSSVGHCKCGLLCFLTTAWYCWPRVVRNTLDIGRQGGVGGFEATCSGQHIQDEDIYQLCGARGNPCTPSLGTTLEGI